MNLPGPLFVMRERTPSLRPAALLYFQGRIDQRLKMGTLPSLKFWVRKCRRKITGSR